MSMLLNNYESKIAYRLQLEMSKKESEEAIREIRESLYGSPYTQIRPITRVDNNGHETQVYPPMNLLINAYNTDDWRAEELRPFITVLDDDE